MIFNSRLFRNLLKQIRLHSGIVKTNTSYKAYKPNNKNEKSRKDHIKRDKCIDSD